MRRSLTMFVLTVGIAQMGLVAVAQQYQSPANQLVGKTFKSDDVRPANSGPATSNFGFPNPSGEKPSRLRSAFDSAKSSISSTLSSDPRRVRAIGDPTRLTNEPIPVADDVYIRYADLMVQAGKAKDALAYYNMVLNRSPNRLEAMIGVARVHDRLGDFDQAWRAYMVAVQTQPNNPLVHNDLGMCCARNRRVEPSVKAFGKAVELNPQKELYRNNLARALIASGRTKEGLQQLLALNPPAVAHYNFAFLLKKSGDHDQARFHLRQSLRLDPNLAPARKLFQQMGGAPRAVVARNPSGPPAYRPNGDVAIGAASGPNTTRPAFERMPRVDAASSSGDAAFQPRTSSRLGPVYLPRPVDNLGPY